MNSRVICSGVIAGILMMGACAEKRTKYSDKAMRIMIDPNSVDSANYVRLQQALMQSGKWWVVDRYKAFKAVKKEQERQHRQEADRYDDKEKWAMWGKMYGVGAIIVANAQCQTNFTWMAHNPYELCLQSLSIVDASSGELITMISHEQEGGIAKTYIAPEWYDAVDKLNSAYPDNFKPVAYTDRLKDYQKEAEAHAQDQRKKQEELNREPASPPMYIEHTDPFVKAE